MAGGMKQLRRMDTAGLPDDFDLPKHRYGFGVSWDEVPGRPKVDIDLQCVVVDNSGAIIDCAYYNNLKAVGGVTHSGDETTGASSGIDELVWVMTSKLPESVALLVFVVAAFKGGQLVDVANGKLHVLEETTSCEVARFDMERSTGQVDVVAAMFRGSNGWTLRIIDEPAREGQHFMDILDLLAEVIRVFVPTAPRRQKVAFAMEKGAVMDLPQSMDSITIGLGWDPVASRGSEVDLDVSAVLLDPSGLEVETVFFQNLNAKIGGTITHTGDNITGEGEGDDEQITAMLHTIIPRVQQVVFVINIYSKNVTFREVRNPYCRIVDNACGSELCRYSLSDAGNENGLIVAKLGREQGGRWGFHALGLPCSGMTYKDSLPRIQQLCNHDTKLLLQRGGTLDLASHASAPSAPPPAASFGNAQPPATYAPPGYGAPQPGYQPGAPMPRPGVVEEQAVFAHPPGDRQKTCVVM